MMTFDDARMIDGTDVDEAIKVAAIKAPTDLTIDVDKIHFKRGRIKATQIEGLKEFIEDLLQEQKLAQAADDGKLWPYKAPTRPDPTTLYEILTKEEPKPEPTGPSFIEELRSLGEP